MTQQYPIVLIRYNANFMPASVEMRPRGLVLPDGDGLWVAATLGPTDNPVAPAHASVAWRARLAGVEYARSGFSNIPDALVDMQACLQKAGAA